MKLVVIDYGMGNLRSVVNAFNALGCAAQIATHPEDIHGAERIVLPGVGAFGDGIKNLRAAGVVEVLEEEVLEKGKPFLGLCLGMQLLATAGLEHGHHAGLSWVPGIVDRITLEEPGLRVPHVGWNEAKVCRPGGLYTDLGESPVFYFVHSYHLIPDSYDVVTATYTYGIDFVASIQKNNIFATQFHPEKSHKAGLTLLKNFLTC